MFRPYDPTETDVGSDLKTMHTDVNDPIGPAPACRVESGLVSSPGRDSRDIRSSRLAEATQKPLGTNAL